MRTRRTKREQEAIQEVHERLVAAVAEATALEVAMWNLGAFRKHKAVMPTEYLTPKRVKALTDIAEKLVVTGYDIELYARSYRDLIQPKEQPPCRTVQRSLRRARIPRYEDNTK